VFLHFTFYQGETDILWNKKYHKFIQKRLTE
jgi:hypothetical protein